MRCFWCFVLVGLLAAPAAATITVDGVLDASYGPALAVQTVQTQFGDEGNGCDDCGGELDVAYAKIWNGRLYLMITGNQEADSFNKLDIFIDSVAGGENVLSGTPQYDFSPGGGFWISQNLGGMTLDNGFAPDYHLFSRAGGGNFEVDFVNRQGGGAAQVPGASSGTPLGGGAGAQTAAGVVPAGDVGPNASGSSLSQTLEYGYNNTNNAGVTGGTAALDAAGTAAALAVTTGMEYSVALADIGNPSVGSVILIGAYYNSGDHNYLSNQFLGGLAGPQGNLGANGSGGGGADLSLINLNNFAGEQYFRVPVTAEVPEPATLVLFGLALAGMACGRRLS
jgi:hypothetical protein